VGSIAEDRRGHAGRPTPQQPMPGRQDARCAAARTMAANQDRYRALVNNCMNGI
jgi:hypothetical protein